ncbi:hypothetical protein MIR68_012641 [Amoeboaphelidium protococcarum]|nr:hypothetical protein MIR68_012641 [Amoeboaphelidium protococcarum]
MVQQQKQEFDKDSLQVILEGPQQQYLKWLNDLNSLDIAEKVSCRLQCIRSVRPIVHMIDLTEHCGLVMFLIQNIQFDQPGYLDDCLRFMMDIVAYHGVVICDLILDSIFVQWRDLLLFSKQQSTAHDRDICRLLEQLASQTGAGYKNILTQLQSLYPDKYGSLRDQRVMTQMSLAIASHIDALREPIYYLIFERLVQLDAEITIDQEELEDEEDIQLFTNAQCPFSKQVRFADQEGKSSTDTDSDSDDESEAELFDSDDDKACDIVDNTEVLTRNGLMLKKLDVIIQLLFDHIDELKSDCGEECGTVVNGKRRRPEQDNSSANPQLQQFCINALNIFDKIILKTYHTKYVQLIMLYISSLDSAFSEAFISYLLGKVFDDNSTGTPNSTGPLKRRRIHDYSTEYIKKSAAAYLGSFMARAKHVSPQMICSSLKICCQWLHASLQYFSSPESTQQKRQIWYQIVQCVLYVFCFRWRELCQLKNAGSISDLYVNHGHEKDEVMLEGDRKRVRKVSSSTNGMIDLKDQGFPSSSGNRFQNFGIEAEFMSWWKVEGGLQRVLFSSLNPLKVCDKHIVEEFTSICKELQIMYCFNFTRNGLGEDNGQSLRSELHNSATALSGSDSESSISMAGAFNPTEGAIPDQDGSEIDYLESLTEQTTEHWFPFDPYYKHLSNPQRISNLYNEWNSIIETED